MTGGKPIYCKKCGHARSHHCRKTNPFTKEYWWGVCYKKDEKGELCSCMRFEEKGR